MQQFYYEMRQLLQMFCLLKNALVQIIHITNTCAVMKLGEEETIAAVKSFANS